MAAMQQTSNAKAPRPRGADGRFARTQAAKPTPPQLDSAPATSAPAKPVPAKPVPAKPVPAKTVPEPRAAEQAVVEEAIAVLVEMMRSAKSDSARRAAAQTLLARGWGPAGAREPDIVIYEVKTGIERA